jgi:lipid A 3-O-deacylase
MRVPTSTRAETSMMSAHGRRLASAVVVVGCAAFHAALGADELDRDLRDMKVFRIEFDNDTFLASDDAFTAGWSLQIHSELLDEWTPGLASWIGRLPTLVDDGEGGRIVRWSWGITQLIITPKDVTIASPQPDDAPWAGILGGYISWSANDDRRLAALQAYIGCMGPCSQAEDVQKFVHRDLGLGEIPEGWSNQLDNELLANLNYEYRRKVWMGGANQEMRGWGHDLAIGAQAGIGTFATYASAWVECRFGWDLPPGFAKFADPAAFGVALDPIYSDPKRVESARRDWRPYFSVVARLRAVDRFAATEGGDTENDGFHRPLATTPGDRQVIVGIHAARFPLAFHLTYYRYFDDGVMGVIPSELDWVNFSFERRF